MGQNNTSLWLVPTCCTGDSQSQGDNFYNNPNDFNDYESNDNEHDQAPSEVKVHESLIYSEGKGLIINSPKKAEDCFYLEQRKMFKAFMYYSYWQLFDEEQKKKYNPNVVQEVKLWAKYYEIKKFVLFEYVRFYKDLLYSIYLKDEECPYIQYPYKAYLKPETIIFKDLGSTSSLFDLYNEKIESNVSNTLTTNRSFSCFDVMDIIKHLCYAVKHCHDRGIMIGNISFDTIFFTDKTRMSSLKLFDFTKAYLIEHKEDFKKAVNLDNLDPYKVSSLEKILLENRYDEHMDYDRVDNSYLAMKPPEFMIGKNQGTDPLNYYKFDIWGIGIIMHLWLTNNHLYENILQKDLEEIHKTEIQDYLLEIGLRDNERVPELDFKHPAYKHVPEILMQIMKMCLKLNVSERATVDDILEKIEPISHNKGLVKYLKSVSE